VGRDDYVQYLDTLLDGVIELDDPEAVFAEAFAFFERNGAADLGTPGPLVHFLERFYPDYVDQLCASVVRKPTTYTVWMLNRLLNASVETADRKRLLEVLEGASANTAADKVVREQAIEFLRTQ